LSVGAGRDKQEWNGHQGKGPPIERHGLERPSEAVLAALVAATDEVRNGNVRPRDYAGWIKLRKELDAADEDDFRDNGET
jgi:hypothetical protein